MTDQVQTRSAARILSATVVAFIVAAVILIVAVLPAEYGIDPTGAGRALGLTALSGIPQDESSSPPPAQVPGTPPAANGAALAEDRYTVELRPFEGVEYKYRLEQGQSFVYSWTATEPVEFEFHGEPDGAPAKYFDSYSKGISATASGTFRAEKSGVHGWFWENQGAARVTVTLRTAGFYSGSTEYRDGERVHRKFEIKNSSEKKQ